MSNCKILYTVCNIITGIIIILVYPIKFSTLGYTNIHYIKTLRVYINSSFKVQFPINLPFDVKWDIHIRRTKLNLWISFTYV